MSIDPTYIVKLRSLRYSTREKYPGQRLIPLSHKPAANMKGDPEVEDVLPCENSTDPNEVDWDGPDDPHNPRNWSVRRRALIVGIVTSIVFST